MNAEQLDETIGHIKAGADWLKKQIEYLQRVALQAQEDLIEEKSRRLYSERACDALRLEVERLKLDLLRCQLKASQQKDKDSDNA